MKKVLSISVGSSSRDHTTRRTFLGEEFELSRQGTDGDFDLAVQRYYEFDGKVDAFGVGGAEFYLEVGKRRYYFRDIKRIREAIKISKVGDGNGVKGLLAKRAMVALEKHLNKEDKTLVGMKALKTNAVDRYHMAAALVEAGCEPVFGDFMFTMNLPIAVHRLSTVRLLAAILLPVITQLPYMWFYPLGAQQDKEPEAKWDKYYRQAGLIAGDFLQIRQHMPDDLRGKIIVTNTTTARNVEELRQRGLHILVTTTPRLEGRSFGTNVMEATMLSLMDKPQSEVTSQDFLDLIERIPLEPNIEILN
ncbi:MAG TPA: quinate 5-dehydrogenase [Anaerolineae bacterium]|nr:quinate 5-dehydrogenase [Anaerolineae bacterium]